MVVTVTLFGKLSIGQGRGPNQLAAIKKDSGLAELNYDEESLELKGSGLAIEKGIQLLAEKDVILPDFSRTQGDLTTKRIKGLMREAKTSVFEGLLDHDKPHCWGQMPWRFITPLTLRKHMVSTIDNMNLCYACKTTTPDIFLTCAMFSILKVEHERKWMED